MAYLLRFDGVNAYVTLASTINISTTDDFSIKWRWPTTSSGNHRVLGGDSVASSSSRIIHFANGDITVYGGTGGNVGFSQATDQSIDRKIELRRVAGSLSLHYDGQQQGPAQNSSQSFTFGVLGANFSTATVASDLYNIEFEVNGQAISFYDPSTSNGTGSILTDTTGSNDGTLVNFPTDNSQWVFYSDGGPTYLMVLEGGDYSLIGGNASLLTSRVMQLDSGAYPLTDGSATLAASRVMQLSKGDYSYVGGSASLLVSRLMSLQSGNYTYTGGSATLTYNQSGGATYTLTLEGGDYTVSAGSAGLLVNRTMQIYGGAYVISDGASSLIFKRKMQLDGAAYLYTTSGVTILARRRMTLEGYSYNYAGGSVTLSYSGEVIALISGYTVQYKSDDVNASYIDDYIKARFQ